mgnify:FL=1
MVDLQPYTGKILGYGYYFLVLNLNFLSIYGMISFCAHKFRILGTAICVKI